MSNKPSRIPGYRIVVLATKGADLKKAAEAIQRLPWHEVPENDDGRYVFIFGKLTVSCKANILSAFELARKLSGGPINNISGYVHPKRRSVNGGRAHAKRAAAEHLAP